MSLKARLLTPLLAAAVCLFPPLASRLSAQTIDPAVNNNARLVIQGQDSGTANPPESSPARVDNVQIHSLAGPPNHRRDPRRHDSRGKALHRADANQDGADDAADMVWVRGHFSPPVIADNTLSVDADPNLSVAQQTPDSLTLSVAPGATPDINVGDILVGSAGEGFSSQGQIAECARPDGAGIHAPGLRPNRRRPQRGTDL